MTVKEVAEYFKKHPRTIYRWIEEEKLAAQKDPGGHGWMVVLEEGTEGKVPYRK
jgi:excisionase family DNA binding protein